jgi:class 3 adenylate cyclase/Tfp pilus assembly protein PilF
MKKLHSIVFKALTLLTVCLFCTSQEAFAQKYKSPIDSVNHLISQIKVDTLKLEQMAVLTNLLTKSDINLALKTGRETLSVSKKLGWKRGIGHALSVMSEIHQKLGNADSSYYYGNASIEIDKLLGNIHDLSRSYNSQGVNYLHFGDAERAEKYLLKALEINKKVSDSSGLADIYLNLANVASMQGNDNKTLEYDILALRIYEKINDEKQLSGSYNNTAIDYTHLNDLKEAQIYVEKAINQARKNKNLYSESEAWLTQGNIYFQGGDKLKSYQAIQNAITLIKKQGSPGRLIEAYSNLGVLLTSEKKYKEAEIYIKKALEITRLTNDPYSEMFVLNEYGNNQYLQHSFESAISLYNQSLEISIRDSSLTDMLKNYTDLSSAYYESGKYKDAFNAERKYREIKEIITKQNSAKELAYIRTEFDTERKQLEIVSLNKDKQIQANEIKQQKLIRNGIITGLISVLIFLVIAMIQKRRISIEKARSEELLLNILPYETAQELKQKGSADAKLFDEVTVLFTDFKGFTQIAEKLSPQELVEEIHYCFKAFDSIMEKYTIEKIKTIGDAYMAAGGLPVKNHAGPIEVVRAAIEIQSFIKEYASARKAAGQLAFEIRIGIHTGPVVAGIVGIKKFQYDIWGDTVNTASRMESSGEVGQINISGTTYEKVKDHFTCEFRGSLPAKNKGNIEMYFVHAS